MSQVQTNVEAVESRDALYALWQESVQFEAHAEAVLREHARGASEADVRSVIQSLSEGACEVCNILARTLSIEALEKEGLLDADSEGEQTEMKAA